MRRNEPSILTAGAATSVAASPSRAWTPAQLRGIQTTGRSLLVSAAAGSGKTAVLAERCAHLVCDADDPCDVDELLVVTFTEAAAAEMKSRIGHALRARARAAPSDRLTQQLALLDRASISTLHGFCSRLLRQHFHAVGLDPGFSVLDADDARLLRNEVARQLFADRYELDDRGTFQRLVDCYADGNDERLVRLVLHVHEMLNSLVDRDGWTERSLRRIAEAAEAPVPGATELGSELRAFIAHGLDGIIDSCDEAIAQLPRLGDFRKYIDLLRDHRATLSLWQKKLEEHGVDALAAEADLFEPAKLPSVRNDVPNKDAAKAAVDAVRGAMKAGPWRDCLRFKSAEWRDGLRTVLPHAREFLSLVEQFDRFYRLRKDASRSVDFSDLERLALKALRDPAVGEGLAPSAAARACHKRFRHVLVDEYQDINEVQDAILTLLSRECVRGEPGAETNLFSVGDVKQSIYRFRLAEPTRFLEREKAFRGNAEGADPAPAGEVIDLQANFRSRAPLLAAVNAVFERLMTAEAADIAYDAAHRLHAGRTFPDAPQGACSFLGAPIELHLLPKKLDDKGEDTPASAASEGEADCDTAGDDGDDLDRAEREALLVARRIREMIGLEGRPPMCVSETGPDGAARYRPMRYGDVVILLRSMKHKADEYAEVLEAAGIPVHSESSTGYFESTEVRDMLALLALLDNQRQDVPLAAVLRSPLADLGRPEDAMARVRLAYPAGKDGPAFHEACRRYAAERDDDLAVWLRELYARLSRWRPLAQRRPLADLIGAVYDDTGYLTYVGALHNGRQRVANLTYLRDRAAQFGSFHRQGLSRFLQFLDSLREESDLGQPSVAGEAEDVVRIMSVHRSKGLEFPVVFLPDLGKAINLQDCAGGVLADRRGGLGMAVVDDVKRVRYPSLASTLVQHRLRQQALAEELRVLYVAMTRAQEHLVMVGTCGSEAPARWAARWKAHAGPLPADAVLGATTMLDWVGPVSAATTASGADAVFEMTFHPATEVATWRHPSQGPEGDAGRAAALARLQPLAPPPPTDPVADEVARRLTQTYAHEAATRSAAAKAMTEMGPRKAAAAPPKSPLLLAGGGAARAADEVGTATHRVLRHLDFRRAASREDVAAQVRDLVERRLLSPVESAVVDVEGLVWLMASDLGRLLRDHYPELRREMPVYAAAAELTSDDPADRLMLRGRVDVLVPIGDRLLVVDYKTDALGAGEVAARAELYRPQVERYADAISRATAKPVVAKLVFLRARSWVDV